MFFLSLLWSKNANAFMALNLIVCTLLLSHQSDFQTVKTSQFAKQFKRFKFSLCTVSSLEMCSLNITAFIARKKKNNFKLLVFFFCFFIWVRASLRHQLFGDVCYVIRSRNICSTPLTLSRVNGFEGKKNPHIKCIICTMHCRYFASNQLNR